MDHWTRTVTHQHCTKSTFPREHGGLRPTRHRTRVPDPHCPASTSSSVTETTGLLVSPDGAC